MKIPLELHALIVDILASESCNLSDYAITCSGLLPLCRAYIFQRIVFEFSSKKYDDQRQRHVQFVQLLARSPEVANMIRNVQLKITRGPLAAEDEALLRAIRLSVGRIELFGLTSFNLKWGRILEMPELGLLIRTCFASPNLRTLEIGTFLQGFRMIDIRACTQLSKLSLGLHRTVMFDDEEQSPSLICFPPNLRHLDIRHTKRRDDIVADRLTTIPLTESQLSPLQSLYSSTSSIELIRIILAQVKDLEEMSLEWNPSSEERPFTQLGESLRSQIRSLKSLTFILPYDAVQFGGLENIVDLLASMSRSALTNVVRDITIIICVNRAFQPDLLSQTCKNLDDIFSSSSIWSCLEHISFEILLITRPSRPAEGERAAFDLQSLPGRLPQSSALGLLRYQFDRIDVTALDTLPSDIHPLLKYHFGLRYPSK